MSTENNYLFLEKIAIGIVHRYRFAFSGQGDRNDFSFRLFEIVGCNLYRYLDKANVYSALCEYYFFFLDTERFILGNTILNWLQMELGALALLHGVNNNL